MLKRNFRSNSTPSSTPAIIDISDDASISNPTTPIKRVRNQPVQPSTPGETAFSSQNILQMVKNNDSRVSLSEKIEAYCFSRISIDDAVSKFIFCNSCRETVYSHPIGSGTSSLWKHACYANSRKIQDDRPSTTMDHHVTKTVKFTNSESSKVLKGVQGLNVKNLRPLKIIEDQSLR